MTSEISLAGPEMKNETKMEGIIEDITKMIESLSRPKLKQYDLEREAQLQGRASSKSFEVT